MLRSTAIIIFSILLATANAAENVVNAVSFESGKIQENGGSADSGFIKTLPNPQNGSTAIQTGSGGCGPNSNCDMRVVRSELVDGQTVTPRGGNYFLRMQLDKSKNYTQLNAGKRKPRNSLIFRKDVHRFDHDVEEWIGFSIFVPKDFETETKTVGIILTEITMVSSAQFVKLTIGTRGPDKSKTHWQVKYITSATSVSGGKSTEIDLGSAEPDKGKWTDFIFRIRSNPFKVDTNPSAKGIPNSKNKMYRANKGILQVWKAEGAVDGNGNRKMVNKINKVDRPIGLVPGTVRGFDTIGFGIRAYKGGWQGNSGQSSSVAGPIWIAWDEVRFGEAVRHGTGYKDVHPGGLACTDRCPDGSVVGQVSPMPPNNLLTGN